MELFKIFVNCATSSVSIKLHFRCQSRGQARVTVIAGLEKLLSFRVPSDHSLGIGLLQHFDAAIGQSEQRFAKNAFALVVRDVNLPRVQNPPARIGCYVDSRASQEDRANGTTISPVYSERIVLRIAPHKVVRQIFHARTCWPEAQRNIEGLNVVRLYIATIDNEWIAGLSRRICRIWHTNGALKIIAAKVERACAEIDKDNWGHKLWVGDGWILV